MRARRDPRRCCRKSYYVEGDIISPEAENKRRSNTVAGQLPKPAPEGSANSLQKVQYGLWNPSDPSSLLLFSAVLIISTSLLANE
jgi:hypothetical protein